MAGAAHQPPRRMLLLVLCCALAFSSLPAPAGAQQAVAAAEPAAEAAGLDIQPQSLQTLRLRPQQQQPAQATVAVGAEQQLPPAFGSAPQEQPGVEQLLAHLMQQQQQPQAAPGQARQQEPVHTQPQQQQQQQPQAALLEEPQAQPPQAPVQTQAASGAAAEPMSDEAEQQAYGQQHEHAACPSPQPPTSVQDVHLAHGSFVWSELAAQLVSKRQARNKQQAPRDATHWRAKARQALRQGRRGRPAPAPATARAPTPAPAGADATDAAAEAAALAAIAEALAQVQPGAAAASNAAAAAAANGKRGARGSVAAADASAEPAAAVSPAAVTNRDFLLSVGPRESGRGFAGTYDKGWVPSDEALAVAPHPTDADLHTVVHGVNSAFEVFFVTKEGRRSGAAAPTGILTEQIMAAVTSFDSSNLFASDPSAWWDPHAKRWFMVWTSIIADPTVPLPHNVAAGPLYVAVSGGADPLGRWSVWVLDSLPNLGPGLGQFCAGLPQSVPVADYPQASYSAAGVFVSVGVYCLAPDFSATYGFMPALFAYSKATLLRPLPRDPRANPRVLAASYTAPGPWTASVPPAQRAAVPDAYKPFYQFIMPVWPQAPEDAARPPLFVMQVDNARMSIATLLDDARLDLMTDTASAPVMLAVVAGKGADFANTPGQPDGAPVLLQPDTTVKLEAGNVGASFTAGTRSYHSVQHHGVLYTTNLEFWGKNEVRVPSVYWAIFDVSRHLCRVSQRTWGLISSAQGLAVSYPVIGAREDGSALVAYAYSGGGNLPNGLGPAFAGVATSVVGGSTKPTIDIVKRGTDPVISGTDAVVRWGDYSAASFVCGPAGSDMWFAVPWAAMAPGEAEAGPFSWQSWVSVQRLSQRQQ